jgi:hypothetical protein
MKYVVSCCFLSMSLVTYLNGVSLDMEAISEKKIEMQKNYDSLKAKKDEIVKKVKKAKAKLKEKFNFFSSLSQLSDDEKQDVFVYLHDLLSRIDGGSIHAYNEACCLFETDNIQFLEEAIAIALDDLKFSSEDTLLEFELCKKYIGDDGLEYDDGEPEDEYESLSFYSLPLHQWEKKVIEKIITSMAEKSLAQLLLDRKEMEKRGDQIHHVHPLRFMGYVMADSYLKSCMNQFKNNSFKWSNFIDGYAQRMREEAAANNLTKHVEGFCDHLKIDQEPVLDFINKGNYEDLIKYLLQL